MGLRTVEKTEEKSVNWKIEQEKLANLKIREKIDVTKKMNAT